MRARSERQHKKHQFRESAACLLVLSFPAHVLAQLHFCPPCRPAQARMAFFDAYAGFGGAPAPTGANPTAHIPKLPEGGYGGAPWQDGPFVKFVRGVALVQRNGRSFATKRLAGFTMVLRA